MPKSNEIAQIEEINKGLTALNSTLSTTSENYLKLVKTISDGNKEIKDNALSFDNLAKAQKKTVEEGKKIDALGKQLTQSEEKLRQTEDSRLKTIIANRVATQERTKAIKDQVKAEQAAEGSLAKMRLELIRLKNEYANASKEVREKMAPAISKLNDEVLKSEKAIGVHQRNVGNYPQLTHTAAEGFNELSSAVGGATGEIGNAITSFATAGGAAGIFTAAIGAVALAWKRVQENIELYLDSADKLKFGFAGYEKDAEKARLDARRRANGQIETGRASLTEANRILDFVGSTAEQKEQAKIMKEQAIAMIAEGQAFQDQVAGIKDKITWTLKYNKLLQEEERLNDEKLENEKYWEELEAKLVEQRHIYNDVTLTLADREKARNEALRIAEELSKTKLAHLDNEIKNTEELAKMTFTQEVVESKLKGLEKERSTIAKEYYQDLVKIDRFMKSTNKPVTAKDLNAFGINAQISAEASEQIRKDTEKTQEQFEKLANDRYEAEKVNEDRILQLTMDAEADNLNVRIEAEKEVAEKIKDIERDTLEIKKQLAQEAVSAIFSINEGSMNRELERLNEEKEKKLENEKLTKIQRLKIEADYAKKEEDIRRKQKKADKLEKAAEIGIRTAKTVFDLKAQAAVLLANPITAALAPLALAQIPYVLGTSALSLAAIAAYKDGTLSSKDKFIAGEAGRELMFLRSGDIMLAEHPTYFEGSKFKGTRILSNPETEKMIAAAGPGAGIQSDGRFLNKLDEVKGEMQAVKRAIQDKPVAIYDKENRMIGHATSHSQEIYLNRLLRK